MTGCGHLPDLGLFPSGAGPAASRGLSESGGFAGLSDSRLQLQHLQFLGSHNSYHRAPRFALARQWRYTHAPLEVQLEAQGVRQFELDVRYDHGEIVVGHLPLIDGRTTCRKFTQCLSELKRWSRGHPGHVPVFVFIEPKEALVPSGLDAKMDAVDAAIRSSIPRDMLLMPEDVARGAPSMREAVAQRGWPTLAETRGRIAFVLFGRDRHLGPYAAGRPDLHGRAMFVAADPSRPETAIVSYDDPVRHAAAIQRAIRNGILVRTRADAGLVRDPARRRAALAGGAHFVGTDFPRGNTPWVDLGGGAPVRCNPISAPARCRNRSLAEVEQVLWAQLTSGR